MKFELTEDHIKLLNRMYVEWYDSAYDGAPVINIKRPYGNSSVAYDVYEIIHSKEWDYGENDEGIRDTLVQMRICTQRVKPYTQPIKHRTEYYPDR